MDSQFDKLRTHFDGLNTAGKKEFITKLKAMGDRGTEHRAFVDECVQKYNRAMEGGSLSRSEYNSLLDNTPAPAPPRKRKRKRVIVGVCVLVPLVFLAIANYIIINSAPPSNFNHDGRSISNRNRESSYVTRYNRVMDDLLSFAQANPASISPEAPSAVKITGVLQGVNGSTLPQYTYDWNNDVFNFSMQILEDDDSNNVVITRVEGAFKKQTDTNFSYMQAVCMGAITMIDPTKTTVADLMDTMTRIGHNTARTINGVGYKLEVESGKFVFAAMVADASITLPSNGETDKLNTAINERVVSLRRVLNDPASLQIHEIRYTVDRNGTLTNFYIDFSANNRLGGVVRDKATVYRDGKVWMLSSPMPDASDSQALFSWTVAMSRLEQDWSALDVYEGEIR
jgi:hypothetical protein